MAFKNFKYDITIMSILLIIVIFSFYSYKTTALNNKIKNLELNENSIYLIQRGTTGKLGNVAKDFNIKNKYASHLGIGYIKNNALLIYHVYVNKNDKGNSLYVETIDNFIQPEDLNYLSIWQLKNIDPQKFNAIKSTLVQSEKQNINFDFNFDKGSKAYYCSEYIVDELKKNGIEIMSYHKKGVTGMISQVLKKDTLTYFPVDGFEGSNKATQVFEWIK